MLWNITLLLLMPFVLLRDFQGKWKNCLVIPSLYLHIPFFTCAFFSSQLPLSLYECLYVFIGNAEENIFSVLLSPVDSTNTRVETVTRVYTMISLRGLLMVLVNGKAAKQVIKQENLSVQIQILARRDGLTFVICASPVKGSFHSLLFNVQKKNGRKFLFAPILINNSLSSCMEKFAFVVQSVK